MSLIKMYRCFRRIAPHRLVLRHPSELLCGTLLVSVALVSILMLLLNARDTEETWTYAEQTPEQLLWLKGDRQLSRTRLYRDSIVMAEPRLNSVMDGVSQAGEVSVPTPPKPVSRSANEFLVNHSRKVNNERRHNLNDTGYRPAQHVNAVNTVLKSLDKKQNRRLRKSKDGVRNGASLPAKGRHKAYAKVMAKMLNGVERSSSRFNASAFDQKHITLYDVGGQITEQFECLHLSYKPQPRICLYPDSTDKFISANIRSSGFWEPHIVKLYQNILYGSPDIGVIDIGANIGVYSILAASMRHPVIAVEPNTGNLQRLHRAIQLGSLQSQITVLQNVVSNTRDEVQLSSPSDNQGAVRVEDVRTSYVGQGCPQKVAAIHMDDILEANVSFKRAIMKIDIEGHEAKAFIHSKKLFGSIFIPYIFMEWLILRSHFVTDVHVSPEKDLVLDLIQRLLAMGYMPYSVITFGKLDSRYWYGWPDDVWWKHDLEEFL